MSFFAQLKKLYVWFLWRRLRNQERTIAFELASRSLMRDELHERTHVGYIAVIDLKSRDKTAFIHGLSQVATFELVRARPDAIVTVFNPKTQKVEAAFALNESSFDSECYFERAVRNNLMRQTIFQMELNGVSHTNEGFCARAGTDHQVLSRWVHVRQGNTLLEVVRE